MWARRTTRATAIAFAAWSLIPDAGGADEPAADAPFVGLLEDFKLDNGHRTQVRVTFRRSAMGWEAMPDGRDLQDFDTAVRKTASVQPPPREWHICWQGHPLGTIKTASSEHPSYRAQLGSQPVSDPDTAPHVGSPSTEFSGWEEEPEYRPLVVNTTGACSDVEGWHPVEVTRKVIHRVMPAMREATAGFSGCSPDNKPVPYKFTEAEVHARRMFTSRDGETLISLYVALKDSKVFEACDGPPPVQQHDQLFHIDATGKVELLGPDLQFLDAGDYAGDGHTEVMMKVGGYDLDGYRIYFDDFRKSASFTWSYH